MTISNEVFQLQVPIQQPFPVVIHHPLILLATVIYDICEQLAECHYTTLERPGFRPLKSLSCKLKALIITTSCQQMCPYTVPLPILACSVETHTCRAAVRRWNSLRRQLLLPRPRVRSVAGCRCVLQHRGLRQSNQQVVELCLADFPTHRYHLEHHSRQATWSAGQLFVALKTKKIVLIMLKSCAENSSTYFNYYGKRNT